MNAKKLLAWIASAVLAVASLITMAPAAQADDILQYQVSFTNGMGVRLRTAPSVNATGFATPYGDLAIPEGSWFPAECEDYGDWVTNIYGETTNIYMRTPGGAWVSTAWLNTGTNTLVGLPLCSAKDAALRASVEPKKVSAYHQQGQGAVMVTNPEQTSGRVYFSKAKTQEAAAALNSANNAFFWGNTVFCATVGVAVGVATGGATLVAGSATGFGADIGCSVVTGVTGPQGFDQARGAANAAASAGKCYEVRMHKDLAKNEWVPDVYTVTDHQDYCG